MMNRIDSEGINKRLNKRKEATSLALMLVWNTKKGRSCLAFPHLGQPCISMDGSRLEDHPPYSTGTQLITR